MKSNSGNVLFLILIAVALFAALSYTVTQSVRSSNSDISPEKIKSAIALANQQAASFRTRLQRMVFTDGITETQFKFTNSIWPSYLNGGTLYNNPNCTESKCLFFSPGDNGIPYVKPPIDLSICKSNCTTLDGYWIFIGSAFINNIGIDANADLIAAFRVTQATCVAINDALGITNPSGAPPQLNGSQNIFPAGFLGVYETNTSGRIFPSQLNGKDSGCLNQNHSFYSNNYAWFYFVLLPR